MKRHSNNGSPVSLVFIGLLREREREGGELQVKQMVIKMRLILAEL